jgi:ribonuclease PH
MMAYTRHDGRSATQLRPIIVQHNAFGYSAASVFLSMGSTKVLCAVTLQNGVPPFLRGKGTGWLNAEYAMLPTSTQDRSTREVSAMMRSGRASEISRFISRALRAVVDVRLLGERTIMVDCDVLQADGGTRTACITAASMALELAQNTWLTTKQVSAPFLLDIVGAISVGVRDGQILLDPDYHEDKMLDADFNIVLTQSGTIVELQGGAEKATISWPLFDTVTACARDGIQELFTLIGKKQLYARADVKPEKKAAAPLFSLLNRI